MIGIHHYRAVFFGGREHAFDLVHHTPHVVDHIAEVRNYLVQHCRDSGQYSDRRSNTQAAVQIYSLTLKAGEVKQCGFGDLIIQLPERPLTDAEYETITSKPGYRP